MNRARITAAFEAAYPAGLTRRELSHRLDGIPHSDLVATLMELKDAGVLIQSLSDHRYSLRTAPESHTQRLLAEYQNRPPEQVGTTAPTAKPKAKKPIPKVKKPAPAKAKETGDQEEPVVAPNAYEQMANDLSHVSYAPAPGRELLNVKPVAGESDSAELVGTMAPTPGMGEKTTGDRPVGTTVPTDNSAPSPAGERPAPQLQVGPEPDGVQLTQREEALKTAEKASYAKRPCPVLMPEALRRELEALDALLFSPLIEDLSLKLDVLREYATLMEASIAEVLQEIHADLNQLSPVPVPKSGPVGDRLKAELDELKALRGSSSRLERVSLKRAVLLALADRLRSATAQVLRAIAHDLQAAGQDAGDRAA